MMEGTSVATIQLSANFGANNLEGTVFQREETVDLLTNDNNDMTVFLLIKFWKNNHSKKVRFIIFSKIRIFRISLFTL